MHIDKKVFHPIVSLLDNSMQMTSSADLSSSVSVCDLCENSLFWRRDSALGITDEPFVKGTQWGAILSEVSILIFMLQRFHEIFI